MPFAGDYLHVSFLGSFAYGVWTDWRDTVQGTDPRESPEDEDGRPPTSTNVALSIRFRRRRVPSASGAAISAPTLAGWTRNIYGDTAP
jgi:hypothetical protein